MYTYAVLRFRPHTCPRSRARLGRSSACDHLGGPFLGRLPETGADAIALQRLVRGLDTLGSVVPGTPQVLVLNRARRSAAREAELRETAERHLARGVDVVVPEDRATVDRAVLIGEAVTWSAPRSTVARRVAQVGELVTERVPR